MTTAQIQCAICGHTDVLLSDHIAEAHGLTVEEYAVAHPGAPVVCQGLWDEFAARQPGGRRAGA